MLQISMPMFIPRLLIIIMIVTSIRGCSSTAYNSSQRIIVSTPSAPKSKCSLKSKSLGVIYFTTPEAIEVPMSNETLDIRCDKYCFNEGLATFRPSSNAEDFASNGLIDGAVPLAIDLVTKKAYSYDLIVPMIFNKKCINNDKGFLDGDPEHFDKKIQDFSFD